MDLCLIAAIDWTLLFVIFQVAVGLGAVIFVHELGHFVVAKLCGVKCEKFYLGFDIGGLKLAKFRYGETEYGIGILPLGGYVKMLGQEDNPARLRDEIERAKNASTAAARDEDAATEAKAAEQPPVDIAAAEQALFDPRSYLAKSVPQRMAIISAGVIMNVIFAFVMAVIAFRMGVEQVRPAVGSVIPGRPAWEMGFRPGDEIVSIGGQSIEKFSDLQKRISLGHAPEEGVPVVLRRQMPDGQFKQIEVNVNPTRGGIAPTIGVGSRSTTTLAADGLFAVPRSAAERAKPPLQNGDRIVQMDEQPIQSYGEVHAYLAEHVDEPIQMTVERGEERVTVTLPPNPMRRLGLVMNIGKVSAIEVGSPAAQAGLQVGDLIREYDGQPVGDPLTWPARIRALAGKTIDLSVQREGEPTQQTVAVTLRDANWYEQPSQEGTPMSVPELGLAYVVLNRVDGVVAGSPADKAGLKQGDIIAAATLVPPKDVDEAYKETRQKEVTIDFNDKQRNWPHLMYALQLSLPGTQVKLSLEGGGEVTLESVEANDWNNPDRGLLLQPDLFTQKAETWGQAVRYGGRETGESLTMVVAFLRKLTSGGISPRGLGGPITIAEVAGRSAYRGLPELLIFLTVLSANLAVLNFLPIPLLDGGHMVFLIYEGIRGKPADERVQLALTYVGLAFILTLMIFVFSLDLGLISRHVPIE